MMTSEERARLERLEALVHIAFGSASAMGGDVTGTTAASVFSKIAALAGGGTQLLVVNNGGFVVSGGPPVSLPYTVTTLTGVVPGTGPGTATFDIDVTTAAFRDSVTYFKAEVYATTKENAGIPTANMTASCVVLTEAIYSNKNGVISLAAAAAGGAANPMPARNNEMTLFPQVCETNLQDGGGAPFNALWSVFGAFARLTVTNGNAANDANVEIDITMRRKMA